MFKIKAFFTYLFLRKNEHHIHSPFVFQLYTKAIKASSNYTDIENIVAYKNALRKNNNSIDIFDLGSGKNKIGKEFINQIAKKSSVNKRKGMLLYALANYFNPKSIVEFGTCFGVSTIYLWHGAKNASIITIEGNPARANIAQNTFHSLLINNIELWNMPFDIALEKLVEKNNTIDLVFIDGNHQKEPTMNYFEQILPLVTNDSLIIFDDIHYSAQMEEAWKYIYMHPAVSVSIDLFHFGLVFFRKECTKQHFILTC